MWLVLNSLATAIGILCITCGFAVAFGAAIGIARMILAWRLAPKQDPKWKRQVIAIFLVGAWLGGMFVATPFYTPYARLALPGLLAACFAASLNWAGGLRANEHESSDLQAGSVGSCLLWTLIMSVWVAMWAVLPHQTARDLPTDRQGLVRIAKEVHEMDSNNESRVIYVLGEPGLYFQLRAAREEIVAPVQEVPRQAATIDGKAVPTFLIVGPHSQSDSQFKQQWTAEKDRFELMREFEYIPSAIVWLDLHDPRKAAPEPNSHAVRLYRLKP
jgi:hypothetical protein